MFVIWCVSLYATFFTGFESFWPGLQAKYATLGRNTGLVITMMPILVLVCSGVISARIKATLVFWRINDPLPGHRAFTKLAQSDSRIDIADLRRKLGGLPRNAKDQNATWYKLYRKYETTPTVENPHRSFLLARDLSTIALLFCLGGSIALAVAAVGPNLVAAYGALMFAQYLLLALVARNHANRLVCNVIVEHLANNNG